MSSPEREITAYEVTVPQVNGRPRRYRVSYESVKTPVLCVGAELVRVKVPPGTSDEMLLRLEKLATHALALLPAPLAVRGRIAVNRPGDLRTVLWTNEKVAAAQVHETQGAHWFEDR